MLDLSARLPRIQDQTYKSLLLLFFRKEVLSFLFALTSRRWGVTRKRASHDALAFLLLVFLK